MFFLHVFISIIVSNASKENSVENKLLKNLIFPQTGMNRRNCCESHKIISRESFLLWPCACISERWLRWFGHV